MHWSQRRMDGDGTLPADAGQASGWVGQGGEEGGIGPASGISIAAPAVPREALRDPDLRPRHEGEDRISRLALDAAGFLLTLLHLLCFFTVAFGERCLGRLSDGNLLRRYDRP